jgi:hypothetical protein
LNEIDVCKLDHPELMRDPNAVAEIKRQNIEIRRQNRLAPSAKRQFIPITQEAKDKSSAPDSEKIFLLLEVFARSRGCNQLQLEDASFRTVKGVKLEAQFNNLLRTQMYSAKFGYKITPESGDMRQDIYPRLIGTNIMEFLNFRRVNENPRLSANQKTLQKRLRTPDNTEPDILKALYLLGFNGKISPALTEEIMKQSTKDKMAAQIKTTADRVDRSLQLGILANALADQLNQRPGPITLEEINIYTVLVFRINEYVWQKIGEMFPETRLKDADDLIIIDDLTGLFKVNDKPLNIYFKSLENIEIQKVDRDAAARLYTIEYIKT